MDSKLIKALNVLLGDLYVLYLEAHAAHWNVEGALFPQLHAFFGELAGDIYGSIDPMAESLRQHDAIAPATFSQLVRAASLEEHAPTTQPAALLSQLRSDNRQVMKTLDAVGAAAKAAGDQGLENRVQERLGAHLKWDWQLKAQMKGR